jgi:hypothetical protein
MLLTMKAGIDAIRALTYYTAAQMDRAKQGDGDAQARVDVLTPVVKAWNTDLGCEIASLGVQVHGGMGFIEETGAAQHFRDARIAPIYEGTNGIQAQDLAFRKVARDGGKAMRALIAAMDGDFKDGLGLASETAALDALESTTAFMVKAGQEQPELAAAAATPYLRLVGTVAGQWMLTRQAKAAERRLAQGEGDRAFLQTKAALARFYARNLLPQAMAHAMAAAGGEEIVALDEAAF